MKSSPVGDVFYFLSLIAFPIIVFALVMYFIAQNTGLPGRRGGPQDAFRHIYASAMVTRYSSPKLVRMATYILERNSASPYDLMDRHNNKLGIKIGLDDKPIYDTVLQKVAEGHELSNDPNVVTWLAEAQWTEDFFSEL